MKVQIGYGQIDPGAKPDAEFTSPNKQPWTNLNGLQFDGLDVKNVATCEYNQAVLDGTQEHLPDVPEQFPWGFWSSVYSDDEGNFENPPTLDIRFSFNHKSPGLTFLFYPYSDDWATSARVTWYNSSGEIIAAGTYPLEGLEGNVAESVYNFRRITVEFLATNIRNRYIKLCGLNYGTGRTFPDEDIDTASILEEVDPTSNEVTINTLNFRLRTHNPEFSMVSGLGDDLLMRNQQVSVVGDEKDFGTFFLQFPWKDVYGNGTVIDFQAVDAIGSMDNYQFWGDVYENVPIESILSQLFALCFPTQNIKYQIDPFFTGKRVSGWIPIGTCRQALQLVCFAIGAVADDSRRDYVWIYPPDTTVDHTIADTKIYRGTTMEPTIYYSGVDVVAHQYVPLDETKEEYNGELPAGTHTIQFSEPLCELSILGGMIQESTANHAVISVPTDAEVLLTGKKYTVNKPIYSVREEIPAGEAENVKIYENCTMLSPSDGQAIAESLFAYLQQRAHMEADVRVDDLEVGYMVQVPTIATSYDGEIWQGRPINGTIEQLDINLQAGKARMKVIGSVDSTGNG